MGGVIAAEASGLPWVRVAHNPTHIRGTGHDVRGPGLPPARGPLGRARDRLVGLKRRREDARYLAPINAVRAAHGLPPLRHPWDLYFTAPLTLAFTAEPFEYPRTDWPQTLRFVGPSTWEPPSREPEWMAQLDDRPLVLVSTSSTRGNKAGQLPLELILDGLSRLGVQAVTTVPRGALPVAVPDNARVERYAPHGWILPRTAAVICHGGAGLVQRSLAAGVPVVAIPNGWDRWEVARRVEVAGAGVRLPIHRATPRRIAEAVTRAWACDEGARRIADAFSAAGGAVAAADSIERLLGASAPTA